VDVVEVEVRAVVREVRTTGGSSEILYLVVAWTDSKSLTSLKVCE
jgi:hypothetical protein